MKNAKVTAKNTQIKHADNKPGEPEHTAPASSLSVFTELREQGIGLAAAIAEDILGQSVKAGRFKLPAPCA